MYVNILYTTVMDKADETRWGPQFLIGGRALADATAREAAIRVGSEPSRWSGVENGRYHPSVRWLGSAVPLLAGSEKSDQLFWWRTLVAAWWFAVPADDQYLMPVLEWGESDWRERFRTAHKMAESYANQIRAGQWPELLQKILATQSSRWPGLTKLRQRFEQAPSELLRPRAAAALEPMIFAAVDWWRWRDQYIQELAHPKK